MGKVSTAYLMTCAAIGVAGGVMLAFAWWLSTALFATVPFASVAIAGLWMMPAVIALRLIRRPFAGLLVGLVSGLVLTPFYTAGAIATTLFWAFFPELPFLVTIYRRWSRWLHYAGAVVAGVAYPILAAQYPDYIVHSLQAYKSGKRKNPIMAGVIAGIDEQDFAAIAQFFGQQRGLCTTDQLRKHGKCDKDEGG